jgi:hypothetical protein
MLSTLIERRDLIVNNLLLIKMQLKILIAQINKAIRILFINLEGKLNRKKTKIIIFFKIKIAIISRKKEIIKRIRKHYIQNKL